MLGSFTAVCTGCLCGPSITVQEKAWQEPSSAPACGSPSPRTGVLSPPQHLSPPVKWMTKDLSYAGSKNQIFLLAFSFVAS